MYYYLVKVSFIEPGDELDDKTVAVKSKEPASSDEVERFLDGALSGDGGPELRLESLIPISEQEFIQWGGRLELDAS